MEKSKKHHYVPQSILKSFSIKAKQKQIYVFDKKTGKSFISSVVDAAIENDFNTILSGEFKFNFEPFFDQNDNEIRHIINKMNSSKAVSNLSIEERVKLCRAAAMQLCRTKMFRTTIMDVVSEKSFLAS
ncbi:DUF4238 domain-containing protein [Pontibacter toksunensis]|uniref:DUF4238 domain-containing protein n=1 Tax=Pontibacter toksunensis TaxID=1332631 RepID=A0ABW6BRN4_9BACT